MLDSITIEKSVPTAVRPSSRVLETASMFGLGVDASRSLSILPRTTIPLPEGGIVFITGPSGSGKSTILTLIEQAAESRGMRSLNFYDLPQPPDLPLVDVFELPLSRTIALLAQAGLGDAFLMLRPPRELSDGQRYRLRLAQAMAATADDHDRAPRLVLADEFGATLDRLTAKIIARNVRRWIDSTRCTFLAATTHDDLLESLEPNVLVHKPLGEGVEVLTR